MAYNKLQKYTSRYCRFALGKRKADVNLLVPSTSATQTAVYVPVHNHLIVGRWFGRKYVRRVLFTLIRACFHKVLEVFFDLSMISCLFFRFHKFYSSHGVYLCMLTR